MGIFEKGFFGLVFPKTKKEIEKEEKNISVVPETNLDGAAVVEGGVLGSYIDIDGTIKNEFDLITRYREMSLFSELTQAIDQITNEAICAEDNVAPVKIDLSNANPNVIPKEIKKLIEEEFDNVIHLLDFTNEAYEIFRRWYIDGRLYYHVVVTEGKEREGIKELRFIDPRQIRKVRVIERDVEPETGAEIVKILEEYYVYNQRGIQFNQGGVGYNSNMIVIGQGTSLTGIKITKDSIVHCHSGLTDRYSSTILSHLHQAIRPLNQLKMMEDASVIYRITRAPERRIFYIDVQDLPKVKAEQYLRELMQKYRNKLVYDTTTGEVRDDRKYQTMLEDFWLPRRNGQNVTQIETLPGGSNLSQIEDIEYFLRKLYQSLKVPLGRLDPNNAFNVGRSSEITRDEVSFSKFIRRLRLRFSMLFDGILEKQLILKRIIKKDDWPKIRQEIFYSFAKDNFFAELKELEIFNERISALQSADPSGNYAQKYYSVNWLRQNLLRQTPEDIKQLDREIENERNLYPEENDFSTEPEPTSPSLKKMKKRKKEKTGTGGNAIAGGKDTNKS